MAEKFAQDTGSMRRQGSVDRAKGDVDYQRAVGDPEWEGGLERRNGKAANAYNEYAREYIRDRERAFNSAGDRRYGSGDVNNAGATWFENDDQDGGTRVTNSVET